jgi:hypothetical protein
VLVRGERITAADLGFLPETFELAEQTLDWPDEKLPSATARLEEMLIRSRPQRRKSRGSGAQGTFTGAQRLSLVPARADFEGSFS